ncbi:thap domain-containing protein 1-like isoform 1 protein [Lasius niger]|uniref:Thap domain-containing protein 1-like isoform 1 protein n=1 Tax=Lasius niger TaxID=67767 RepID=A0A0J7KLP6_LASNI|nr:thap domain-containing protein 1-like isoform 1 protein [Lasius niger]
MVEKCYLCENKYNKNENIVLHRFPKKCPTLIHTHQQWLNACGLNEQDDVSNVYICTSHFESSVFRIKNKRLRLHRGATPTIDVLNPVVKEKNIENDDETATNIFPKTLADSITIDDRMEEQLTSPNSNIDTENNEDDHEEQLILQRPDTGEPDTLQFNIPESVTPVKQRRFAETRYISEIDLCDVATPRRAKRTLTLVKLIDKKKSKQIKRLQDTNRKLNKRIISLQQMVSHIRKKGLISKDAKDVMLVS